MKFIATNVDDSLLKLADRVAAQQDRSGFALDPYFYRSHITYQVELEHILYKSWLYAGHIRRHRGARVCDAPQGNRSTFVCPYHRWVYRTDGSLKLARDMDLLENFRYEDYGLKPVSASLL